MLFCRYQNMEMSGIEPEAFRMRNRRSTTELHPLTKKLAVPHLLVVNHHLLNSKGTSCEVLNCGPLRPQSTKFENRSKNSITRMSYFQEGTASDGIFSLLGKGDKQNQELPCSKKRYHQELPS